MILQLQSILLDTLTSDSQKINKIDSCFSKEQFRKNNATAIHDKQLTAAYLSASYYRAAFEEWALTRPVLKRMAIALRCCSGENRPATIKRYRIAIEPMVITGDNLKEDDFEPSDTTFANGDMDDQRSWCWADRPPGS